MRQTTTSADFALSSTYFFVAASVSAVGVGRFFTLFPSMSRSLALFAIAVRVQV